MRVEGRLLAAGLIGGAALLLAGCDRETRASRGEPLPETIPIVATTALFPGNGSPPPPDPRAALYLGNAFHVSEGQRLYTWMNCVGCHFNGGGGIGPALMDDQWIYGGRMDQIVASIANGRPNGMPSWRGKLTEQQMWQIAAYVKSLSGAVPKDVPPSRADHMSSIEPLTLKDSDEADPTPGAPAK